MLDWRVDTFLDVCETLNYTHTAKRLEHNSTRCFTTYCLD